MFFDDYPRFHETSQVGPSADRLNLRYEAIFGSNRDIFAGARVLDLACNDGRWSFAALKTGAAHVTGIEARPELCENAEETMRHYEADPQTYEFVCGDVLEKLRDDAFEVDVVLCLGYLYHTYRHTELLHFLRRLNPTYLVIDTHVIPRETRPVVQVKSERPHRQGTAVLDPFAHGEQTLVALPSLASVLKLMNTYGFGVETMFSWPDLLATHPQARRVGDDADGWRVTLRCRDGVPNAPGLPPAPPVARNRQSIDLPRPEEQPLNGRSNARSWRRWGAETVNRGLLRATGYRLTRSQR